MQTTEKLALDVAEAAELLGISKPTMYNICNRADFTAMFKIGTRTKIRLCGTVKEKPARTLQRPDRRRGWRRQTKRLPIPARIVPHRRRAVNKEPTRRTKGPV